jgi:hypothetical protein
MILQKIHLDINTQLVDCWDTYEARDVILPTGLSICSRMVSATVTGYSTIYHICSFPPLSAGGGEHVQYTVLRTRLN